MKKNIEYYLLIALSDTDFTDVPFSKEAFVKSIITKGKLSDKLSLSTIKTTKFTKKLFPNKRPGQLFTIYLLAKINKKYCRKCDTVYNIQEFGVNTTNKDGRMGSCKSCHNLEQKQYYYKDPKAQAARVRKRERNLDRALSSTELTEIFYKYDNKCTICGYTNLDHNIDWGQNLHLDHIIPVSKGGKTTISNIQLLCIHCNCSKGSRV